jgi:hypothetical protein
LSDFSDNSLPVPPAAGIPERLDCPQAQSVPDNASRWKARSGQAPELSDFPDDRMTDRFTRIWLTKQPFFCTVISRRDNQYGMPKGRRRSISVHRLFQFCTAPSGQDNAGNGEHKIPSLQHAEIQIFSIFLSRRTPLRRDSGNFFASILRMHLATNVKDVLMDRKWRFEMKGKSITKSGVIRGLSQNETMQLSQLLTPIQRQRINDGDSVLVKTEYILDSWKEYWIGKESEEE